MIVCLGPTPAVQRVMLFKSVTVDAVNRASHVAEGAAGKSVNVAKVLSALGKKVIELGFVGGERGRFLCGELDRLCVPHDMVPVAPQTRLCITLIDQAAGTQTELVEESHAVAPQAYEALVEKLARLLSNSRILVLSGSLTPDAPQNFYEQCVRLANAGGIPVILDAQGLPLIQALPARPAIVKPNRAELAATVGFSVDSEPSLQAAMKRLMELGAGAVVVTMGREGAAASDGRSFWKVTIPRIDALNPIGSGDAFTAGLACGVVDGWGLGDSCRLGAACGVANALTMMAGDVRADDVARLIEHVRVERM